MHIPEKIIAWTLSETLEVSCIIDTINKAKARRTADLPLIIHSEQRKSVCFKSVSKSN